VATYERLIRASLTRIWENVLDWEHLPWLHRTSFAGIDLRDASADGWRAIVRFPGGARAPEADIEVRLDRPHLRYVTRTLDGFGAGTDITTVLTPAGKGATRIAVAFDVPNVDPAHADAYGAAYVRTYARLWDEDEAMMMRRQAILDPPRASAAEAIAAEVLGSIERVRAALPLAITWDGAEYRIVEVGGVLVAHATTCPHLGGPLADTPVEDGCVTCPWHGYRFDVVTGANVGGGACRLAEPPAVEVADGVVRIVARPAA
jgi:nitrite reductase/ring-hydroxylating ferredoxin subunit